MALALSAVFSPTVAGGKGYKCDLDTQTCLNRMVAELKTSGWLGIEYDLNENPKAPRITRVVPGSPAEATGFHAGDILVSLNGTKYSDNTDEKCGICERMKDVWKPGTKVRFVVRRDGKEIELDPTLSALPPDVMAMMVGMHMMEHARPEDAPK